MKNIKTLKKAGLRSCGLHSSNVLHFPCECVPCLVHQVPQSSQDLVVDTESYLVNLSLWGSQDFPLNSDQNFAFSEFTRVNSTTAPALMIGHRKIVCISSFSL